MSNVNDLLTQALALVNADQRGELADLIEAIVTAARQSARCGGGDQSVGPGRLGEEQ